MCVCVCVKGKVRTSIKVGGIIFACDKALEEISTATKVLMGRSDASVQNIDIGTLAGRVVEDKGKVVQWVTIWRDWVGEACDAPGCVELTNKAVLVHSDGWELGELGREEEEGERCAHSWMYSTFS